MEQLNKEIIKKDLEVWAKKLREVDQIIRELYLELNEVYGEIDE